MGYLIMESSDERSRPKGTKYFATRETGKEETILRWRKGCRGAMATSRRSARAKSYFVGAKLRQSRDNDGDDNDDKDFRSRLIRINNNNDNNFAKVGIFEAGCDEDNDNNDGDDDGY